MNPENAKCGYTYKAGFVGNTPRAKFWMVLCATIWSAGQFFGSRYKIVVYGPLSKMGTTPM